MFYENECIDDYIIPIIKIIYDVFDFLRDNMDDSIIFNKIENLRKFVCSFFEKICVNTKNMLIINFCDLLLEHTVTIMKINMGDAVKDGIKIMIILNVIMGDSLKNRLRDIINHLFDNKGMGKYFDKSDILFQFKLYSLLLSKKVSDGGSMIIDDKYDKLFNNIFDTVDQKNSMYMKNVFKFATCEHSDGTVEYVNDKIKEHTILK